MENKTLLVICPGRCATYDSVFHLLVAETGEHLVSHLCSHYLYAKGDLYEDRPERIEKFTKRFGEIEVKFIDETDISVEQLLERNKKWKNENMNIAETPTCTKPMLGVVLSLFDGMSCGQIALNRAGISYGKYYASEIDKHAIKVTQHNYPDTIQLGSVTEIKGTDLPQIDLLIGGSPCQGFSFAGKGLNFEDPRSKLFFEFVRLKNETQPKYWLLENVKMKAEHQNIISEILGVKPILINSGLVSAQSRDRLYWTNIPIIELPTNKGILLKDIIDIGEPIKDKSQTILATLYKENAKSMIKRNKTCLLVKMSSENPRIKELSITDRGIRPHRNDKRKSGISEIGTIHYPDTKSYTITANHAPKVLTEIIGWRKLTPKECERLQTVPDNYTDCVSDTQRYKMLGNGWTVDVIAHIFSFMALQKPKSEGEKIIKTA